MLPQASGLRPQVCSSTFFYLLQVSILCSLSITNLPVHGTSASAVGLAFMLTETLVCSLPRCGIVLAMPTANPWSHCPSTSTILLYYLLLLLHVALDASAHASIKGLPTMLLYQFRSGTGDQQHRTAWKSNARLFHLPMLDHLPQVP